MSDDGEPSKRELLDAVEEANDLLVDAMDHANRYTSHEEVRPSAVLALRRAETAHATLSRVDPTREITDEEGEQ